jgi:class 3 adenylate cyclase
VGGLDPALTRPEISNRLVHPTVLFFEERLGVNAVAVVVDRLGLPRAYLENTEAWCSASYTIALSEGLAAAAAGLEHTPPDGHEVWQLWRESGWELFEPDRVGPMYGVLRALGSPQAVYPQVPRLAEQTNRTLSFEQRRLGEGLFELTVTGQPGSSFWVEATRWSVQGILEGIPTVWGLPRAHVEREDLGPGTSRYLVRYALPAAPWRPVLAVGVLGALLGFGAAWALQGPLAWGTVAGAAILLAIDGWRRVIQARAGRREDGARLRATIQGADARYDALWDERESLRRANLASRKLSGYLSGDVVERILEDPELELSLGGQRTHAAVLFADIVGFTPRCESMSPEQVVEELNLYFGHIDPVFVKHGGVIDKRIGDGVMVVFVPGPEDDLAQRSVSAGLDMLRAVLACNQELEARGGQPLAIRVGVAQGPLVQGNMGSKAKLEYTVIGDTVNLAARLESSSKPGHLLVQTELLAEAGETSGELVETDTIRVKGKSEAIQVSLLSPR